MKVVWLVLGVLLAGAAVVFGVQNTQATNLNAYPFYVYAVPLWVVAAGSLGIGLLVGLLLTTPGWIRAAARRRRAGHELADRDRQIAQLRQRVADLEGAARPAPAPAPPPARPLPEVPDVSAPAGPRPA